ncbi:hydrogenase expression/formation protein [bacterium]|nr:hydrogenase expression/formation protein [bacterium]
MEYLKTGKIKTALLSRLLSLYRGKDDPSVILGPSVGEDSAIISLSNKLLVAKTDPITFVTEDIGWYVVNVNANDILTRGATPRWFMATVLLPEGKTTEDMVERIFSQVSSACNSLGVALVGGHTEVTVGLDRPIVVGCMLGEMEGDKIIATSNARVGDYIVITKGIAVEGTAIIAKEKQEELLRKGYNISFLERCKNFLYDPGISIYREVNIGKALDIHAMHDPTEGGLSMGIYEICMASNTGALIYESEIPIFEETLILSKEYGINPLGLITSGTLLIVLPRDSAEKLIELYRSNSINASIIGEIKPKDFGIKILSKDGLKDLIAKENDEIIKIFE